jgi:hypothetical protein
VRWRSFTGALLGVVIVSACSAAASSTSNEYRDPEGATLMTFPPSWHVYGPGEVAALSSPPFVSDVNGLIFPPVRVMGFDGSPNGSDINNIAKDLATIDFPIGAGTIRTIGDRERDFVSRSVLSQASLPYYGYNDASENLHEDFSFGNGYDGVRRRITYTSSDGSTTGVAYLIAVTDPGDTTMFSAIAGCSLDCYARNQTEIERTVDSWLVNTKV